MLMKRRNNSQPHVRLQIVNVTTLGICRKFNAWGHDRPGTARLPTTTTAATTITVDNFKAMIALLALVEVQGTTSDMYTLPAQCCFSAWPAGAGLTAVTAC